MKIRKLNSKENQTKYIQSLSRLFLVVICVMVLAKVAIQHKEKSESNGLKKIVKAEVQSNKKN